MVYPEFDSLAGLVVRPDQTSHQVYPGDELAEQVEQLAEERGVSISAFYAECARREVQAEEVKEHRLAGDEPKTTENEE